jgi:hypothetical protein
VLSPLGVYERPIPDPVLLPYTASHIDRLLEAQGEVFAAQVETGSAPPSVSIWVRQLRSRN